MFWKKDVLSLSSSTQEKDVTRLSSPKLTDKMDSYVKIQEDVKMLKELGVGCFGVTHLVQYKGENAVMKLGKTDDDDGQVLQMFHREASILKDIDGAGGCPQLLVCAEDRPCLVMSYVSGPTMQKVEEEYKLSRKQWLKVYVGLVKAVRELHGRNMAHCDLKADNIILDMSQRGQGIITPRIIDVGLSHTFGSVINFPGTSFHGKTTSGSLDVIHLGQMIDQTWRVLQCRGLDKLWPRLKTLKRNMMDNGKPGLEAVEKTLKKMIKESCGR